MTEKNIKTVDSDIATIKFSGGADDDSSSDESVPSEENQSQVPVEAYDIHSKQQKGGKNPFEDDSDTNKPDSFKTSGKTPTSIKKIQGDKKNPFCTNEDKNPFYADMMTETDDDSKNPFSSASSDQEDLLNPFLSEKPHTSRQEDTTTTRVAANRTGISQHINSERKDLPKSERFNPFNNEDEIEDAEEVFPQLKEANQRHKNIEDHYQVQRSLSDFIDEADSEFKLNMSEDHFALPEGFLSVSDIQELERAIDNCKKLVLQCPEKSESQKEMVNKLIQLRLRLIETKEGKEVTEPDIKNVVGHKFMRRDTSNAKHYCEKCNTMIWGVWNYWYRCKACGFCVHAKCLNQITRTCASLQVVENPQYVLTICPEKGLAAQNYKCAECRSPISYQAGFGEPRQCDYTGNYYCNQCHWNDQVSIPARILHNWDFEEKGVCRASKQFLKLMCRKPVLRVQDINPMLFSFVEELNQVKKLREEILIMKRYFLSCKSALKSKLLLQLRSRQHFVENSDMYSLQDLLDTASDIMLPQLAKIHSSFAQHVKTDCQTCQGKGFVCELCNDHREILFPFDNHAVVCAQCSTVLHRHCFTRKNQKCPKCERINRRSVDGDVTS